MTGDGTSVTAPALVVVGYLRPHSMHRILTSLARLDVPAGVEVPLVISIDGKDPNVLAVVKSFEWSKGPKRVITRVPRLGLRDHILACGDLAEEYGAVVILEDDLYASPDLVRYVLATHEAYADDPRIAGVSLYAVRINELNMLPFYPCDDGHDAYFAQFPCSWGQMWTSDQWKAFRAWYDKSASDGITESHGVPRRVRSWPETSWKKYFCRYMVEKDRWFVYPRQGVTTNSGDMGTHTPGPSNKSISFITSGRRTWSLPKLSADSVRYDAWFEPHVEMLQARWPTFDWSGVTIDFHGLRDITQIRTERLLSIRPCRHAETTFPLVVLPLEMNLDLPGTEGFFSLGPTKAFRDKDEARTDRLISVLGASMSDHQVERVLRNRRSKRVHKRKFRRAIRGRFRAALERFKL